MSKEGLPRNLFLETTIKRSIDDFNSNSEKEGYSSIMDAIENVMENSEMDSHDLSRVLYNEIDPSEEQLRQAREYLIENLDTQESPNDLAVVLAEHLVLQEIESDFPEYAGSETEGEL